MVQSLALFKEQKLTGNLKITRRRFLPSKIEVEVSSILSNNPFYTNSKVQHTTWRKLKIFDNIGPYFISKNE